MIWLVCTGLGRINRGFEQHISSLAGKLADIGLPVLVASGGQWTHPQQVKSMVLPTPHRESMWLRGCKNGFIREQQFFALALIPALLRHKPAVIYLGEYRLYCYLFKLRNLLNLHFSLCLYTGGQAIPGHMVFDANVDYVHHVTPAYLPHSLHLPSKRQVILPHFIIEDFNTDAEKEKYLRDKAGGKKIVLSVGFLDMNVKQMHLIAEVLGIEPEKWFPILLGAPSADTNRLRNLFTEKFGDDGFIMETIPHAALGPYYRSAAIFVTCSPRESFGLAMVEALYHGLPVVAHDFFETQWVLEKCATLLNVNDKIKLLAAIENEVLNDNEMKHHERISYVYNRFTWHSLKAQYASFFTSMLYKHSIKSE